MGCSASKSVAEVSASEVQVNVNTPEREIPCRVAAQDATLEQKEQKFLALERERERERHRPLARLSTPCVCFWALCRASEL